MREFEERFITMGLPYKVIGGPRFYERAEIRDALAYLRCIAQPDDDLAFERIYNQPKRGLGDATLALLHEFGRRAGVSLMRAAQMLIETEEMKPRPRQILRALLANFDRWRKRADELPQEELAQLVLEESGYVDMWKAERTPDAAGRLDNLKELVRSMGEFPDLGAFLEHVSLVMDVESADGGERVSIMTLHAAKGLEFDLVFLPGWEEGLFPHQRSLDDNGRAGLEEERRLAYVGLTRARRAAKIYHAANRRVRGLWQTSVPSRFIDELPPDHVEVEETASASGFGGYGVSRFDAAGFGSRYETPGSRRAEAWTRREEASRTGFGQGSTRPPDVARDPAACARDRLCGRRARLPPQIRAGQRGRGGRAEAHHRFRPRRPQAGDGELRHARAIIGERRAGGVWSRRPAQRRRLSAQGVRFRVDFWRFRPPKLRLGPKKRAVRADSEAQILQARERFQGVRRQILIPAALRGGHSPYFRHI